MFAEGEPCLGQKAMGDIFDLLDTRPWTFVHSDFNPGNIWKKVGSGDEGPYTYGDWQLGGRGPPCVDFINLLVFTDCLADEPGRYREYFETYHKMLVAAQPKAAEYPLEQMWSDLGLSFVVIYIGVIPALVAGAIGGEASMPK